MSTLTTSPPRDWTDRFIGHLESLRDRNDRGSLAALRRGLGRPPGTVMEMQPIVAPLVPSDEPWLADVAFLIASLFAYHPVAGGRGDLGAAMRRVFEMRKNESLEKRFVYLLDSHRDDLANRLRQIISLCRAEDVAIDFRQLCRDLRNWDHPDAWVQKKWARSFWGGPSGSPVTVSANPPEAESSG